MENKAYEDEEPLTMENLASLLIDFSENEAELFPEAVLRSSETTSCSGNIDPVSCGSYEASLFFAPDIPSYYPPVDEYSISEMMDSHQSLDVNVEQFFDCLEPPPMPPLSPSLFLSNMEEQHQLDDIIAAAAVEEVPATFPPALPQPGMFQPVYNESDCALPPLPPFLAIDEGVNGMYQEHPGMMSYLACSGNAGIPGYFPGGVMSMPVLPEIECPSFAPPGIFDMQNSFQRHRACGSNDMQVLGKRTRQEQQQQDNSMAIPATDIPPVDESAFKVGRLSVEERKAKINRYLQKRSQRNFSKKIKYACRKTLADSRPRVRGRFAKNEDAAMAAKDRVRKADAQQNVDDEEVHTDEDLYGSDILAQITGLDSFDFNSTFESWM